MREDRRVVVIRTLAQLRQLIPQCVVQIRQHTLIVVIQHPLRAVHVDVAPDAGVDVHQGTVLVHSRKSLLGELPLWRAQLRGKCSENIEIAEGFERGYRAGQRAVELVSRQQKRLQFREVGDGRI